MGLFGVNLLEQLQMALHYLWWFLTARSGSMKGKGEGWEVGEDEGTRPKTGTNREMRRGNIVIQ